jgi:hypothetical protein
VHTTFGRKAWKNDKLLISRRRRENNINMYLVERRLSAVDVMYPTRDLEEPMVGPCEQSP